MPRPNDKCPCGSGKKYKKCCARPRASKPSLWDNLSPNKAPSSDDLEKIDAAMEAALSGVSEDELGERLENPDLRGMMNRMRFKEARERMVQGGTCCICNVGKIAAIGIYIPEPEVAKKLGQPEGKQRLVQYGMCAPCMQAHTEEEISRTVEKKLLGDIQSGCDIPGLGW